jgi:hypothetical protein
VSLPEPQPGLVIRYSYLWRREASKGMEDGRKDRPCVMVAAVERDVSGKITVVVLPVTHSEPTAGDIAIEIPQPVTLRLKLDEAKSWILLNEGTAFIWPGPDLRPQAGRPHETVAYGFIPPRMFGIVRARFVELQDAGGVYTVQ